MKTSLSNTGALNTTMPEPRSYEKFGLYQHVQGGPRSVSAGTRATPHHPPLTSQPLPPSYGAPCISHSKDLDSTLSSSVIYHNNSSKVSISFPESFTT